MAKPVCPRCKSKSYVGKHRLNVLTKKRNLKFLDSFLCEHCCEAFLTVDQISKIQRGKLYEPKPR